MTAMKLSMPYIFKKIYNDVAIFCQPKELKLGYLNTNHLYHAQSVVFINNDQNLLNLDFLVVADTRLTNAVKTNELESKLFNWKMIKRMDSNDGIVHMGLLMLKSNKCNYGDIVRNIEEKIYFKQEKGKKINRIQIMTASFINFNITCAFVYVRKTPSEAETYRLEKFLKPFHLVMGDLNLDAQRSEDDKKLKILCETRKKVLNEITTIRFNQLDHILLNCDLFPEFFATCFRNHTTDHYTTVLRIAAPGNSKTELCKKVINFDQEHWTKLPRKRNNLEVNESESERSEQIKKRKESIFKRQSHTPNIEKATKKQKMMMQDEHRTFKNRDAESCWINSCLQMILTAMDYQDNLEQSGSSLWNQLNFLLKKGNSLSLDPLPIRDTLFKIEKQRIVDEGVIPVNRLFGLGYSAIFQQKNLLMDPSDFNRLGQQDCKDFFICLSQNKQHWYDVYSLFKIDSISYTTCSVCSHVSRQGEMSQSTYFLFECPSEDMSMSEYVDKKLNKYKPVFDWRDEDGCQRKVMGKNSTRIKKMDQTNFLIIILDRLISIDGNLEILQRRMTLGNNVLLHDIDGNSGLFKPIAVIHHSGEVIGNTTRGHYQADVLDKSSGHWFRTSDDELPQKINQEGVTDQGYIFLYMKFQGDNQDI